MMLPFTADRLRGNWDRWCQAPTHQWDFMILEDPLLLTSLWAFTRNEPKTRVDNYRSVNQIILALGMTRVEAWLQKTVVMSDEQWCHCAPEFTSGFMAYQLVHEWLAGKQEDIPEELYMACILGNMPRWAACTGRQVPIEILPEFVRELRDYGHGPTDHHDWTATARRTHLVHTALRSAESLVHGIPTPLTLATWSANHRLGLEAGSIPRAVQSAIANNPGYVLDVLRPWVAEKAGEVLGSTT